MHQRSNHFYSFSKLMLFLWATIGFLSASYQAESVRLPEEFPLCKVDDPEYDVCLKDASQEAFSLLRNGIPSLGLEPLDPLFVKQIKVQQGAGAVIISLTLTNSTISGMKNVKVLSQSNNLKTQCNMNGEVFMPEFAIISNYKISGKVMLLPVSGDGICNVTMKNVNVKAAMKCEKFEIDGEEYLNITQFNVKIEPKDASINLGNLFGGDEALGKAMNQLINLNSRDIIRELSPAIADSFNVLFRDISNKIFHQVPYKNIFLH